MASTNRVQLIGSFQELDNTTGDLKPVASTAVTVTNAISGNPATLYSGMTGTGTIGSLYTDGLGNILPAYVVEGLYTIACGAATIQFSAVRGDSVGNLSAVTQIQNQPIATTTPATNQGFVWNGSQWAPSAIVNNFNGRTGSVTPSSGDYTAALVGAVKDLYGGLKVQADVAPGTVSLSPGWTSFTITFGTPFTNTPAIICTPQYASLDYVQAADQWALSGVTNTHFTINIYSGESQTVGIPWVAIGV
jgi:hypothetical protein